MKKTKKTMKYLVAVKFGGRAEIWQFDNKTSRKEFIREIKVKNKNVEYATSSMMV